MANAIWPGKNPIGQHFHRDWAGSPPVEVVGVVPTGKYTMLLEDPKPYYYTPLAQFYDMPVTLVIRTLGDPHAVAHEAREVIRSLDHDLPVYADETFEAHMLNSAFALMPLVGGAMLAAIQGAIGLLLAIMGLYAVVSYGVTSRTREIGVRVALGATHDDVVRFISREGLRLTSIGLAIGLVMALGLSFGLAKILPGVHALDPVAFPAVIVALLGTAALACYLPARRAARVDPMVALRAE
jgi:putative ABC transport system permease protein